MASCPLDPAYKGQHTTQPFITKGSYHRACPPELGACDATSGLMQVPAIHNVDLFTRLAVLQKELEHCHAEKAEAEIAVQYLAHLNAGNAMKREKPHETEQQILILKRKLLRAKEDKQKLQATLDNALSTILLLSSSSSSRCQSTIVGNQASRDREFGNEKAANENEVLIDLLGSDPSSTDAQANEDSPNLLKESCDGLSDGVGVSQGWHTSSESFTSDSSASSYIFRFGNRADDHHSGEAETLAAAMANRIESPSSSSKTDLHTSFATTSHNFNVNDSSNDDFPLPSGPISAATSFGSDSLETASSKLHVFEDTPHHLLNRTVSEWHDEAPHTEMISPQKSLCLHEFATTYHPQRIAEKGLEKFDVAAGEPRWKISKVIDSNDERTRASFINERIAGAKVLRPPEFFKHDIRFIPGSSEQNVYRTIVISGLPINTSLMSLLDHVRGGAIYDAKLLDTRNITGAKTALVTFLAENAAFAYLDHAKMLPITINHKAVQVSIVPTPTWPISVGLCKCINALGNTRCFEVHDLPCEVTLEALKIKLTFSALTTSHLESIKIDRNDVLELRFSSIKSAIICSEMFKSDRQYRGCRLIWVPDPCAQPLETLFQEDTRPSTIFEDAPTEPAVDTATIGLFENLAKFEPEN